MAALPRHTGEGRDDGTSKRGLLGPSRRLAATATAAMAMRTRLAAVGLLEAARAITTWLVRRRFAGAAVVAVPFLDAQLLLAHPHFLQVLEHFLGHAVGQVDQAVFAADAEAADKTAFQARFIGDGADDVAWLHAMLVADFDAIGPLALLGVMRTHRARTELARRAVAVAWFVFACC